MSVHENPRAQDSKKVAIVGVGMVGMSFAYAMLNQNICDELCLIDINKERAEGEAMDLSPRSAVCAEQYENLFRRLYGLHGYGYDRDLCRCSST